MLYEPKVKGRTSQTNFRTTMKPVFLNHHTTNFLFRQKQLPTFCPICPSHVVQNEKMKSGTLTTQLASPQKHPCCAHMLSGTKCRCVPYKPCHAICAPSPSVKERGRGEKGETGDNRHLFASLLATYSGQSKATEHPKIARDTLMMMTRHYVPKVSLKSH